MINQTPSFTRSSNQALVNSDNVQYNAARTRMQKQIEHNRLIEKVEKLESCVENLKLRIEEIEKNGI